MWSSPTAWLRGRLTSILGEFIKEESFDSLNASLWAGTLVLENAELKETFLENLGIHLPVALRHGSIGHLEVTIPWTSITTNPIIIRADNLMLVGDARYNFAEEIARVIRERAAELAKLAEESAKRLPDPVDTEKVTEPTMLGRFVTSIVDGLQVVVNGIHIRIEDRVTCPGCPFAYGFTAEALTFKVHPAPGTLAPAPSRVCDLFLCACPRVHAPPSHSSPPKPRPPPRAPSTLVTSLCTWSRTWATPPTRAATASSCPRRFASTSPQPPTPRPPTRRSLSHPSLQTQCSCS